MTRPPVAGFEVPDDIKEISATEKETFRAMYFQFVGYPIDRTFDAEKAMKTADQDDIPI